MSEMKLTDAELARLEELAAHYASGNALPFAEDAYRESACNATPALVAEVRRLRDRVEALEKTKKHLSETARVLAEQVGNGNLGKIQDALDYAHYKASEREAMK